MLESDEKKSLSVLVTSVFPLKLAHTLKKADILFSSMVFTSSHSLQSFIL
jgi:hypothetical protein